MITVTSDWLRGVIARALHAQQVPLVHAQHVSDALLLASERGIDSHGVTLFPTWLKELEGGRANPQPSLCWRQSGAVAQLDADAALGAVAGAEGVRKAAELAAELGVGVAAIRNTNHFGAASAFTLPLAAQKLIGIAVTNADRLLAPHGGRTALFGTNPLSFAVAGVGEDMFCLDMATSQISYSKLTALLRSGATVGRGFAIDDSGEPLTSAAQRFGALLPLGGYKGAGLAMMVSILAGALTDSPFDAALRHLYDPPFETPRQIGQFLLAIDPTRFVAEERWRAWVSDMLRQVETQSTAEERVRYPGARAAECQRARKVSGIPITQTLHQELLRIERLYSAASSC